MRRGLLSFVVLACLAVPASAAASNDSWTSPDDLFFSTTGTANTVGYGVDAGEPLASCAARGKTAWWRIAGTGQTITISTAVGATNFNTVLAVYTGSPPGLSPVTCNDNFGADPLHRSQVSFASVRGTSYLVQVGGWDNCAGGVLQPCPESGTVDVQASSPTRPDNDDRAHPEPLPTGAEIRTNNVGASREAGEDLTCVGSPFAATVWYRWTAPAVGTANFQSHASYDNLSTNKSDTVLAVYRADTGARIGCNDDAGQLAGPSHLTAAVTPGDYLLQVGAHGTEGVTTIGQGDVFASVDFVENKDLDGDGIPSPADCNDHNPAIHPGAPDPPGDGIDQNCDGHDSPFPTLLATVSAAWGFHNTYTELSSLVAGKVPGGSTLTLTCAGRRGSCAFKKKVFHIAQDTAKVRLTRYFRHAHLAKKTKIGVSIAKPATIGGLTTFTTRNRKLPRKQTFCLPPNGAKPVSC